MPKGRRTNNRHKRKRLPPGHDSESRGTASGRLRKDSLHTISSRRKIPLTVNETLGFLDRLRRRFRRRNR